MDAQGIEDWEKVHEVALALFALGESHRKGRASIRNRWPAFFLEEFERQGYIEDCDPGLDWIELTEAGARRSQELLMRHFGVTGVDLEGEG